MLPKKHYGSAHSRPPVADTPGPPEVTTPFEVHRQFGCDLARAFAVARFLSFGDLPMQNGSTAAGDPFVQHVAVQNVVKLEPSPGMPHEPLLPGESGQRCFDIVRREPGSAGDGRGRKSAAGHARNL